MNYAERCRMCAAVHWGYARFWTEDSAGTLNSKGYAKRAADIAALLDAAMASGEGQSHAGGEGEQS